jgi:excisionase family DNA binding protein
MTLQTLLDQMPQSIADAPHEQLAAVMAQLAACQSAVAARLLDGHQNGAEQREIPAAEPGGLLTIEQVARRLNVPKSNAYELVRSHKLVAVRLGKYVRVAPEILAHYVATLAAAHGLDTMSTLVKRKK